MFMSKNPNTAGIRVFQKYLTVWVALCMVAGVLIGKFLPQIPTFLNQFEYANVSIPIAILIWLMIYPMMMKVDFQSIKNVGKTPKGLFVTWVTNWLIKPFTMYGIAGFFFFCSVQGLYHTGTCHGISGRCGVAGSSSVYGYGICVEYADQRESCLHSGAGGNQ